MVVDMDEKLFKVFNNRVMSVDDININEIETDELNSYYKIDASEKTYGDQLIFLITTKIENGETKFLIKTECYASDGDSESSIDEYSKSEESVSDFMELFEDYIGMYNQIEVEVNRSFRELIIPSLRDFRDRMKDFSEDEDSNEFKELYRNIIEKFIKSNINNIKSMMTDF